MERTVSFSSRDTPLPGHSRLISLPLELQYHVITYLDWHDARRLRLACRFYGEVLNYKVMDAILQRIIDMDRGVELFYLWHYNPQLKEGSTETFVCSGCRWILPKECYSLYDIGSLPENRECFVCKVRKARIEQEKIQKEGIVYKLEGGSISFCGRCGQMTKHSQTVSLSLKTCYWCSLCTTRVGKEMRHMSRTGYILKWLQILTAFLVMCLSPTMPYGKLKIGGTVLGTLTAIIHALRMRVLLKGKPMHRWHSVACYVRYWTKEIVYFVAWLAFSVVALTTVLRDEKWKYYATNIANLCWTVIILSFLETSSFLMATLLAACLSCNILDGYMHKV